MDAIKQFQVGKTYSTRSIGDQNCVFSITVIKRTEKTVTTSEGKLLRIQVDDDIEKVRPLGTYSMAPTIRAI